MNTFSRLAYWLLVIVLTVPTASGFAQQRGGRGAPAPQTPRPGHPSGKLVIWGDTALFVGRGQPDNCIVTNRFKRGQRVGFRMVAFDGGTGEAENTAVLTAHVNVGGKTIDVPLRWRGPSAPGAPAPQPEGYLRPITNMWAGDWVVPEDAPTGMLSYTVTARDQFGRTATFEPFSVNTSQLTIVD